MGERMGFLSFPVPLVRLFIFSLLLVVWEAHYDRSGRSGRKGYRYIKTATAVALGSGGAAAMALRAACSGISNTRSHTRGQPEPPKGFLPAGRAESPASATQKERGLAVLQ